MVRERPSGRVEASLGDPAAARGDLDAAKRTLRAARQAGRRARPEPLRAELDARRDALLLDWIAEQLPAGAAIALYLSMDDEPSTCNLLALLHERAHPVLLPVLTGNSEGTARRTPDWGWFRGVERLRTGLWGIREPSGATVGPDGLAEARLVVCPALAATPAGVRLGKGSGWYDRALVYAAATAVVSALLYSDEIVDDLPSGRHDVPVHLLATEGGVVSTGAACECLEAM